LRMDAALQQALIEIERAGVAELECWLEAVDAWRDSSHWELRAATLGAPYDDEGTQSRPHKFCTLSTSRVLHRRRPPVAEVVRPRHSSSTALCLTFLECLVLAL
jgi:hypothetical protein